MLPEHPDEEAIKKVLNSLGSPAALAEKYRQNPRYLISPAYFDEYTRTLKWVLPLVGLVVMAVGMLVGALEAMKVSAGSVQELRSASATSSPKVSAWAFPPHSRRWFGRRSGS
jgi:hypothetical protein